MQGSELASATDPRWDLTDEAFVRWWQCIPEEDRAEFIDVYGGDENLARFVCSLDYLTMMQARPQVGSTIVAAWAAAAHVPHSSEAARRGAAGAWGHDAVQALLDRLRYRTARQAAARITNRLTATIEQMLTDVKGDEVDIKDKAEAAKVALAFVRMVSQEDIQERIERTKRGFIRARATLVEHTEAPTPEQMHIDLRILRQQLGDEAFKEAMVQALE